MQSSKSILLLGLTDGMARELQKVLARPSWTIHSQPCACADGCREAIERFGADLVFCSAESRECRVLLEMARQKSSSIRVVIVSRRPEVSDWLDAIEAGASDYCAPPFDSIHMQWIVQTALKSRPIAA